MVASRLECNEAPLRMLVSGKADVQGCLDLRVQYVRMSKISIVILSFVIDSVVLGSVGLQISDMNRLL